MQPTQQQKPKSFADINEHALDIECSQQPRLMLEWRDKLAEANKDLLEAEANLKAIKVEWKGKLDGKESQLQLDIRRNPIGHGLPEKITEKMIESRVMVDPILTTMYAESLTIIAKAEREANTKRSLVEHLDGAVEVLRQRKSMLEKLCDLALSGHYANLRPPQNPTQQANEAFVPKRTKQ